MEIPLLISELSGRQYEREIKQIRDSYVDYNKRNRIRKQGIQRKETASPNPVDQMVQKGWQSGMRSHSDNSNLIYPNNRNTDVLSGETVLLSEQTTLLENNEMTSVLQLDNRFNLVRELLLIHTDEKVEETYS